MTSFLDDIVGLAQLQQIPAAAANISLAPSTPLTQQDPPENNDDESSSDSDESQNGDKDQDTQAPATAQDSHNTVAAFTVNTSRNLRLTSNGEESLLRFSQVFFPFSLLPLAHDVHTIL